MMETVIFFVQKSLAFTGDRGEKVKVDADRLTEEQISILKQGTVQAFQNENRIFWFITYEIRG